MKMTTQPIRSILRTIVLLGLPLATLNAGEAKRAVDGPDESTALQGSTPDPNNHTVLGAWRYTSIR